MLDSPHPVDISDLKDLCSSDLLEEIQVLIDEKKVYAAFGKTGPQILYANVLWERNDEFEMMDLFKEEFFKLKVPDDTDVSRQLAQAGIAAGETLESNKYKAVKKERKPRDRSRRIKITNVHLTGTEMDVGKFISKHPK